MNIVRRNPGIMLLEQYGNKYIRYDAGQISDVLLQIRITEEEFDKVQKEEITMESVVNYYDNRGLCSADELRSSLIKDYLRTVSDYSEKRLTSIVSKLIAHKDVYFEFYDYVLYEQFPEEDAIVVEGLSAQQLATNYPLSPLGAYNYLIYLREMPEKALADLKAGLPTKDSSKIDAITNQEEIQKTMDEKNVTPVEGAEQVTEVPNEADASQGELLAKLDAVQQAAFFYDVLDKGRERLGLIGFSGGHIGDDAGIKIHIYLVAGLDIPGGFPTFHNRQADIDSVSVKNPGKSGGDDHGDSRRLDGDRGVLPG